MDIDGSQIFSSRVKLTSLEGHCPHQIMKTIQEPSHALEITPTSLLSDIQAANYDLLLNLILIRQS